MKIVSQTKKTVGKGFEALAALRSQIVRQVEPKVPLLLLEDLRDRVNLEELMAKDMQLAAEEDLKAFSRSVLKGKPGYVNVLPASEDVIRVASDGTATLLATAGAAPPADDAGSASGGSSSGGGGDDDSASPTPKKKRKTPPTAEEKALIREQRKARFTLPPLAEEKKMKLTTREERYRQRDVIDTAAEEAEVEPTPDISLTADEARSGLRGFAADVVAPAERESGIKRFIRDVIARH